MRTFHYRRYLKLDSMPNKDDGWGIIGDAHRSYRRYELGAGSMRIVHSA